MCQEILQKWLFPEQQTVQGSCIVNFVSQTAKTNLLGTCAEHAGLSTAHHRMKMSDHCHKPRIKELPMERETKTRHNTFIDQSTHNACGNSINTSDCYMYMFILVKFHLLDIDTEENQTTGSTAVLMHPPLSPCEPGLSN